MRKTKAEPLAPGKPNRGDHSPSPGMAGRRDAREREVAGSEQIVGRHPVLEALKAGTPVNKILVAEGVGGGSLEELIAKAREQGIVVQRVPRRKLEHIAVSPHHQGVVAYVSPKEYVETEDIVARVQASPRPGLVVVLDEVEDPFNLGSILRTAEGAGVHGVIIPKRRSAPLTAAVAKASAGALEHMPVARVSNVAQTLEKLKKAGFWITGADANAPVLYDRVDYTAPTAFVIGNEGKGLGKLVKDRCDYLVRLPMVGKVGSLNAGVAAGILLYEALRQRGQKRNPGSAAESGIDPLRLHNV
jgi:23S rRNA (guanosine2251-2'-O)-methyltransferase